MTVVDASALLVFLQGEAGADRVEKALPGGVVGAANWSEVAQKVIARGGDWDLVRGLLESFGLQVEPVTAIDAERAARAWQPGAGLSLADRLCLALGDRLGTRVLTADRTWGDDDRVEQIR